MSHLSETLPSTRDSLCSNQKKMAWLYLNKCRFPTRMAVESSFKSKEQPIMFSQFYFNSCKSFSEPVFSIAWLRAEHQPCPSTLLSTYKSNILKREGFLYQSCLFSWTGAWLWLLWECLHGFSSFLLCQRLLHVDSNNREVEAIIHSSMCVRSSHLLVTE